MSKNKKEKKRLENKILTYFKAKPKIGVNYKQLAAALDIRDTKGRNHIIKILNILHSKKIITQTNRGQYHYNTSLNIKLSAIISILPTGKGLVIIPETKEEILIPKKDLNKALHGDRVEVALSKTKKGTEGSVECILERSKKEYVGILEIQKDFGFVSCRNSTLYTDFFIEKKELKDFKNGDKVVVVFKDWKTLDDCPTGSIIKSLGLPGTADTEIHAILHEYGLPYSFPETIEEEANALPTTIEIEEVKKRRDFRSVLTFTIDPIDAKDYDDALSFVQIEEDIYEIGIHIADVSHYVQPDSQLDQEAYERATSVYLVDRVVPMLPESLSNGLCSLRPNEDKLTFSAVFHINKNGEVKKEWFGKTIIHSDYRFSYEEVQYVIENNTHQINEQTSLSGHAYSISAEVKKAIDVLNDLAKKLRKKRMINGAISFDRQEVRFQLSANQTPEAVFFKRSKEANKLIEEFMLLANKQVAMLFNRKDFPFVFRIHDDPDIQKLYNLKKIVSSFGYSFNPGGKNLQKEINNLLSNSQGKREQNLIDTLTLRSMSKAEYSTQNIGHYGLAFEYYTHFTSPIRRYPDVLVHRLLQLFLNNGEKIKEEILEEACIHSSNREQLATKAERDSIKYMQMVFLEDKIGKQYDGVISGVTERGLYVEIIENKCEGMIRTDDLKDDYYIYDLDHHAFVGQHTQKVYQLGDLMKIRVKKVNLLKRFIDFVPAS